MTATPGAPAAETSATFGEVDTADREPRHRQRLGRETEQLQPTCHRIVLRRRRERRDAHIVGAARRRRAPSTVGRGEPEQPIGTDELPRLRDRQIAPADVDAVGATRLDQIRPVVEDEERAVLLAGRPKRLGRGDE